jgi:hypothetical protein
MFHGRSAHVVRRELLELHFDVECSAYDLHKLLMSHVTLPYRVTEWGQYNKPEIIEDCVHVIEQAPGKSSAIAVRNELYLRLEP